MRIEHRLDKHNFDEIFDLIVIGGGINGAGVARDAAERGLKVLLLEKTDFAAGCSSHSTRLIHGGLRYLEYLEFDLVKESLLERDLLLKNYPHLVSPIGLLVPSYKGNKYNPMMLNIGMFFYHSLAGDKNISPYQKISKDKLDKLEVGIETKGFNGGVYYYDGQVQIAERLVLENIQTAIHKGAICLNHVEVSEVICTEMHGKHYAQGVRFKDTLNAKRPYTAYAKNIVNMAGPWVDLVNDKLKEEGNYSIKAQLKDRMGGTKGSHIVVKSFAGAPTEFGIYNEAKADSRPIFILPYKVGMNEDLYLVGTTDIFVDKEKDNLDKLEVTQKEISYLINEVNELFPQAFITEDHIVNTFVGVRPLPGSSSKKAGKVTRRHFIIDHAKENVENYYSIVGGKLTTFRSLSKEVVDKLTDNHCYSHEKKTLGCNFPENKDFFEYVKETTQVYSRKYDIDAHTILHLIMIYGTKANEVLDLTINNPRLKNKISKDSEDIEAQIVYAIRREMAFSVDDIIFRRLSLGLVRNEFSSVVIDTIKNYINQEFELEGRHRDKAFEDVLMSSFKQ